MSVGPLKQLRRKLQPLVFFRIDKPYHAARLKTDVCRGLIECLPSAEELAVIISHEVAHVQARHLDERLSIARFPSIIKTCYRLFKLCDVITAGTFSLVDEVIGQTMKYFSFSSSLVIELPFSRLHECEADEMGCRMLLKLCIRRSLDP